MSFSTDITIHVDKQSIFFLTNTALYRYSLETDGGRKPCSLNISADEDVNKVWQCSQTDITGKKYHQHNDTN